ncbi:hypothetical protein K458DRAFT_403950 [Lentithecium fluviatile CBS 122367]|uniref:Uncharacterized protein n=1 Tax=Lentithecium fluviatile CBS 122367 TaxID=1168545 RepID=A0A6G1J249_9PLEO|nr:hypothetical protein K458DRAFT_403950 [Lentithecium fluviatile CBS 122367]
MANPLFNRLKPKLAPIREAALGIASGSQTVSDQAIASIEPRDTDKFHKAWRYKDLEDEEWYELIKVSRLTGEDCKDSVSEKLWRAAVMHEMCQKIVYCLIVKVRAALQDDPDVLEVRWCRYVVRPNIVLFTSDRDDSQEIPIYVHDMMYIHCKNNVRFVLDVSGDQYGFEEWFFSSKYYYDNHRWDTVLQRPQTTETQLVASLEGEEPRLPALKDAVEKAVAAEEARWAAKGLGWSSLHRLLDDQRNHLFDGIADRLEQVVVNCLAA